MSDTEIGYVVLDWWKDLSGMKKDSEGVLKKVDAGRTGERAELRRCKSPEQAMLCKGYHRLRSKFQGDFVNQEALALIAGLCSHIRTNDPVKDFPVLLATPEKEKTTPPLSESRFQKIVTSRTASEFYTGLRRALQIVDNKGNIPSIARGVLMWYKNRNNPAINIQETMMFQWSKTYYDEILKNDK